MTETMLERFMRIFDMKDPNRTAYQFLMPHVAISGEDIEVDFDRELKCWRLTQHHEDGVPDTVAYGDTQLTAVLALIAKRWGYDASFVDDSGEGDQPSPSEEQQ
jgi:hypothetical protein